MFEKNEFKNERDGLLTYNFFTVSILPHIKKEDIDSTFTITMKTCVKRGRNFFKGCGGNGLSVGEENFVY